MACCGGCGVVVFMSYLQVHIESLEVKGVVWLGRAWLVFELAICSIVLQLFFG